MTNPERAEVQMRQASRAMTQRQIESAMRRRMRRWKLFNPRGPLFAIRLENGDWSLGYASRRGVHPKDTHWDANIIKGVFYLLRIQVAPMYRGRGDGAKLYELIEQLACDLGCTQIRQHPSGWTPTGETRKSYLERRGWIDDGIESFKLLAANDPTAVQLIDGAKGRGI